MGTIAMAVSSKARRILIGTFNKRDFRTKNHEAHEDHEEESLLCDLCDLCGSLFFWLHDQLDALVEREVLRGGRADVSGFQRAVPREILVEPAWMTRLGVVRVQLIGLAAEPADALHPVAERRLDRVDRSL